ncbi:MAG: histidinol-phosphate transaminase [Gemmatimonadaceae bacterium]
MSEKSSVSRRGFVGGLATVAGYLTLTPSGELMAQEGRDALRVHRASRVASGAMVDAGPLEDYDAYAKLASNENPYGPPDSVMKAMTQAFKYANRYSYPDGEILQEIARYHGVQPENVLLGAGSGELLKVVGATFLTNSKMVVGAEPTFNSVYEHAAGIKADAIKLPLLADCSQDIPAMIHATRTHYRDIGFVYLCNPNNPTGRIVTKGEVRQLLDGIPEDIPVLIDEAYHHFVDSSDYATSLPYVLEGRQVIVTRTFSKIAALAGMRLGYAVAPTAIIDQLRPHSVGSINAIVKWGGVAALKDTTSQASVKKVTIDLRTKATTELTSLGYTVIPSDTNFFMVHIRRPVLPVIAEFKRKGVLVGRPFPPMNDHLRVSVGTPEEMQRFSVAFREIFSTSAKTTGGSPDR